MKDRLKEIFHRQFQVEPEAYFWAPGRVNLIGEHTDYNDGFVLPVAIHYGTFFALRKRADRKIVVYSENQKEKVEWEINAPFEFDEKSQWSNYLRGVSDQLKEKMSGLDIAIVGNVPRGAGLSSSASLTVGFTAALDLGLSKVEIAKISQKAENDYVGCQCGLLDQLASVGGVEGKALLIDCQNLEMKNVELPQDLQILIIDSKVQRGLVDSEYNLRREQCEEAARACGASSLREVDFAKLESSEMSELAFKRARHVLSENERVLKMVEAFSQSDLDAIANLMAESHKSMKEDFEITTGKIDKIVDVAAKFGGARMTGGGFGGCVIALSPKDQIDKLISKLESEFSDIEIHKAIVSQGAGSIE